MAEGLSLVKMRETCPTWKSPDGRAQNQIAKFFTYAGHFLPHLI